MLYQLSYDRQNVLLPRLSTEVSRRVQAPSCVKLARRPGLEPGTPDLEGRCSIQLSYPRPWGGWKNCSSRGERIRTSDPLRPRQVRYQAALRPEKSGAFIAHSPRARKEQSG